jgi:hypothetical protein
MCAVFKEYPISQILVLVFSADKCHFSNDLTTGKDMTAVHSQQQKQA